MVKTSFKNCPIIWTRSVAAWQTDRKYLQHLAREIIHIPCISTRFLFPPIHITNCPYAVVTSTTAIEAIEQYPQLKKQLRSTIFFCFGARTKAKLHSHGYQVYPNEKDVNSAQELGQYISKILPSGSAVIVLTAQQSAFPMTEELQARRLRTIKLVLYQTNCQAKWPSDTKITSSQRQKLASKKHIICFASPSAVVGFYQVFSPEITAWRQHYYAVAIGNTTMQKVERYFRFSKVCAEQSVAALAATAFSLDL